MLGIWSESSSYIVKPIKNLQTLSWLGDSNLMSNWLGSSSHSRAIISFEFAHFRILWRFYNLTPKAWFLCNLYDVNSSALRCKATKATWDISIAWKPIPSGVISKVTWLTTSLIESTIFFNT